LGLRRVKGSRRFFKGYTTDWWGDDASVSDSFCYPLEESLDICKAKLIPVIPGRTEGLAHSHEHERPWVTNLKLYGIAFEPGLVEGDAGDLVGGTRRSVT
jgi:hypothetical protein